MKTVLVTGASRGIGLEIVRQLLDVPSVTHIFAACRTPSTAEQLGRLRDNRVHIVQLDVQSDDSIAQAVKDVEAILGGSSGLNVLLNNAGVLTRGQQMGTIDRRAMAESYDVNTIGPILVAQAFLPLLRRAAEGNAKEEGAHRACILNMSTGVASLADNASGGRLGGYAYRCSKTALNMGTTCEAVDLRDDGIMSVCLLPGYVSTDMTGNPKEGAITVEESVKDMLPTLLALRHKDNGSFVDRFGKTFKW